MPSETVVAPKQTLLAIADTLSQLFELLDNASTAEEIGVIEQDLARVIGTELAQKVDGIAWFHKRCKQEVAELKELIEDIDDRIRAINIRKAWLRDMTKKAMQQLGVTLLKGQLHSISLREGAEELQIDPGVIVPDMFCTVAVKMPLNVWNEIKASAEEADEWEEIVVGKVSVDEAELKKAIEVGGFEMPGVRLEPKDDILVIR